MPETPCVLFFVEMYIILVRIILHTVRLPNLFCPNFNLIACVEVGISSSSSESISRKSHVITFMTSSKDPMNQEVFSV